jgi:hypothetical protein
VIKERNEVKERKTFYRRGAEGAEKSKVKGS